MFRYTAGVLLLIFTFTVSAETVLITGSNRGMGLEFVKQYADLGWDAITRPDSIDPHHISLILNGARSE